MNGLEQLLTLMDKHGISIIILGVILFLIIKYTPKFIEQYKCYIESIQKFTDKIEQLVKIMENLSDDVASLDVSVDDLRKTMNKVSASVNHNSDNLLHVIEQISFIKGKLNHRNE